MSKYDLRKIMKY